MMTRSAIWAKTLSFSTGLGVSVSVFECGMLIDYGEVGVVMVVGYDMVREVLGFRESRCDW